MTAPTRRLPFRVAAAALSLGLAGYPAAAEESFHLFTASPAIVPQAASTDADTPTFGHLLYSDLRHVATSPARLRLRGWLATAAVVGVLGARVAGEHGDVDAETPEGTAAERRVASAFEPLGDKGSIAVLGTFFLAGAARHDPRAKEVAADGAIASLIASVLVTPALKEIFGRSRPRQAASATDFHPFSSRASFPSGHTTEAFALASVIAGEYDSRWVDAAAYGSAALVGYARVLHDAHYVSDVMAGALVGTLVGRAVVSHNRRLRGDRLTFAPMLGPEGAGVTARVRFR